jgi:BRCT domain type II-containing protein
MSKSKVSKYTLMDEDDFMELISDAYNAGAEGETFEVVSADNDDGDWHVNVDTES